jgi:hypothetical protein
MLFPAKIASAASSSSIRISCIKLVYGRVSERERATEEREREREREERETMHSERQERERESERREREGWHGICSGSVSCTSVDAPKRTTYFVGTHVYV